ncbi:MAG TPA: hypothetical protein VFU21_29325 [Kofleriaceae bacterium]|nr:hypothetical protein [Kofleriaceae bacterium]
MIPAWLGHLRDRLRAPGREPAADPHLEARARRADGLLAAGRREEAVAEYLEVFARDPGLMVELGPGIEQVAAELGGDMWLDFRLAGLRAALEVAGDDDADTDWVREAYGELLEEHRDDGARLARIREVGRLIDAAVARGDLPRALIRRGPR